jgi:DNA ligase-1
MSLERNRLKGLTMFADESKVWIPPTSFRPMLSAKLEDYPKGDITAAGSLMQMKKDGLFPLYCSPKLDGIRVLCHPSFGPVSRTIKPINNKFIWSQLHRPEYWGLDGEIVCGVMTDPQIFNQTQSVVMSQTPSTYVTPFTYIVFDHFRYPAETYTTRKKTVDNIVRDNPPPAAALWNLMVVHTEILDDIDKILEYEAQCVATGFEGMMIRAAFGKTEYKYGRSTAKQASLIKVKRFTDAEGVITDAEELVSNQNEDLKDAFGLAKRSSHQANLVPMDTLGALVVTVLNGDFTNASVNIGTGFDADTRKKLWEQHKLGQLRGKKVSFKYQSHGSKDAPRIPVYRGIRYD